MAVNTPALQRRQPRIGLRLPILMIVAGIMGAAFGLGSYTFFYAKGTSYITDDPAACANCHIMRDVYTAWSRGSHRSVAVCNDCHTPHDSIVTKYAVKAINGFNHSWAFTTGNFPEPIRITPLNRAVAQQSCLGCHGDLTGLINHRGDPEPIDCLQCHSRVGHDE